MRAPFRSICFSLVLLLPGLAAAQQGNPSSDLDSREEWLASYRHFGVAASLSFPYADFGDLYKTGYGLHALVDYPLVPLINIAGSVAWTRFPGEGGGPALDAFSAIVEGRVVFAFFYVGGGTGYLTGVKDVGWVPSVGLRFDRAELSIRWVAVGPDAWTTLRAGFYF